jgi:hypothetical protein
MLLKLILFMNHYTVRQSLSREKKKFDYQRGVLTEHALRFKGASNIYITPSCLGLFRHDRSEARVKSFSRLGALRHGFRYFPTLHVARNAATSAPSASLSFLCDPTPVARLRAVCPSPVHSYGVSLGADSSRLKLNGALLRPILSLRLFPERASLSFHWQAQGRPFTTA